MRALCYLGLTILASICAQAQDQADFFETRVRPVFVNNCHACHTATMLGGLRLDSAESIRKGGKSGPVIVPGKPDESLLIQAVRQTHERLKMPPTGKLRDQEIADLVEWVRTGAVWPSAGAVPPPAPPAKEYTITPEQRGFWSFQPVRKASAPAVQAKGWVRNPIDNFVLAKIEERGLKPARPADKRVLIRRAALDLTGLPPTPEEVDAFLADRAPDAFAKVVDRLLASPRYGERWGRYWLDVARYSDDKLASTQEELHPNAHRYRDWVISAFNADMPYDVFVKAQIAGDLLPSNDPMQYQPGLGFYALSPEMQDERVDATSRGFLALTVACAQCHDHKFDPIPTKDFYSLQGIFTNSEITRVPLAPAAVVADWDARNSAIEKLDAKLKEFVAAQTRQLGAILAGQTARYMLAARAATADNALDQETLRRWTLYLNNPKKLHPYLTRWFELTARSASKEEFEAAARAFQTTVEEINEEKELIDERNKIKLGLNPTRQQQTNANLDSLSIEKYSLWRDLFERSQNDAGGGVRTPEGVLYYGDGKIDRFLSGEWKQRLESLRSELASLKKALPPQYPYLETIKDRADPRDLRIAVRGDANNRGDVAPRQFLTVLHQGAPKPFTKGSGRLELAEAIVNPGNPLTPRVMMNRIWQHHFGHAIVDTPGNFGQLGSRPSHPELLDYLAARFIENQWSIKAMHREIMLSAVYALGSEQLAANQEADPENRLFWRANWRRMDAEALRDSLLFVAGNLDLTAGGPPVRFEGVNRRRAVYGFVSRRKPDPTLALFDFPVPNATIEERVVTNVPLQRLFMMNSAFVQEQARAFAKRLSGDDEAGRIRQAYRILYGRLPSQDELASGQAYLRQSNWDEYARVLLNTNEFFWLN